MRYDCPECGEEATYGFPSYNSRKRCELHKHKGMFKITENELGFHCGEFECDKPVSFKLEITRKVIRHSKSFEENTT